MGKTKILTEFWSQNLKGKDHSKDRDVNGWEDNIRMDYEKQGRKLWTGFIRHRTGTSYDLS